MRRGRGARLSPALLLVALAFASGAAAAQARERLIDAIEHAPATLVAEVAEVEAIDTHGYRGELRVETPLVGEIEPGATLSVAWEELAPSRPPRFANGDRVLVSLEPLAGASIWLARIPDPAARARTLGIALRGEAYLHDPAPASVTALEHYLALPTEIRDGPTGVATLAALAARAQPALASAALARLARVADLDAALEPASAAALVSALLRSDMPAEFSAALLDLVAARGLTRLRPPLTASLRATAAPPPLVLAALAILDGGLPPEQGAALLDPTAPVAQRRVAARWARGPDASELLVRAARNDPDPEVRSHAVTRLAELGGANAVSDVAVGLYDPDVAVRAATVTSLANFGSAAVPELRAAADAGTPDAARAAVAGLHLGGSPEGAAALAEIASDHPDPQIRKLARFALGEELGHGH